MIETLQELEDSYRQGVMFRWQGMTIFLGLTPWPEGGKFLTVIAGGVSHAELIHPGNLESLTMLSEVLGHKDAIASTTCNGSVPDATGLSTED